MNKILIIIKREFLNRVQKKSFLLVTILTPLVFPAIFAGMIWFAVNEKKSAEAKEVIVLDESGIFSFESDARYKFTKMEGSLDQGKKSLTEGELFGFLHIPSIDIYNPQGITLYTRTSPSMSTMSDFKSTIERQIKDVKLTETGVDRELIKRLETKVTIGTLNVSETGVEKESDAGVTFGIGYGLSFLIYLFIFIYGAQVMQGVLDEKTSKIVEVIVSTVRPFQLMMGKVVGVASVGLLQFLIWAVLIGVSSVVIMSAFGLTQGDMEAVQGGMNGMATQEMTSELQSDEQVQKMMSVVMGIPYFYILSVFLFYFLGGYLLYGALFAAVGSAVDNIQDAQQFTFPITMPMIIGFIGSIAFVLQDPTSSISFWLSIIPLTSPVAMMARIGFGVPAWELALSMVLLILGFIFTIWVAGRIYRIGILMHGTKINYKILFKWMMMK